MASELMEPIKAVQVECVIKHKEGEFMGFGLWLEPQGAEAWHKFMADVVAAFATSLEQTVGLEGLKKCESRASLITLKGANVMKYNRVYAPFSPDSPERICWEATQVIRIATTEGGHHGG